MGGGECDAATAPHLHRWIVPPARPLHTEIARQACTQPVHHKKAPAALAAGAELAPGAREGDKQ